MKKFIGIIALVITCCFVFAACSPRTETTAEEFKTKAEAAGYTVTETKAVINTAMSSMTAEKNGYEIIFTDFISSFNDAKSAFNEYYSIFHLKNGSYTSVTGVLNYDYYKITSDGKYYVVSRISATLVLIYGAQSSYKKEIDAFLKQIGY